MAEFDDAELDRILNQEATLVMREEEMMRVLRAFKLNPYDILDLDWNPHNKPSDSDIHRVYRKKSLMIHPDKLKHPKGIEAFDLLKKAETELLDEKKREELDQTIADARMLVMRQFKLKPDESDDHPKLRNLNPPFRDQVRAKTKELLIDEELRRRRARKMTMIAEGAEAKRVEEEVEKKRKAAEDKEKWEQTREDRVSDWRSFQKAPGAKLMPKFAHANPTDDHDGDRPKKKKKKEKLQVLG